MSCRCTSTPARPSGLGRSVRDAGRIAAVVRERFGVDYTLPGVDLLLHRLGWSVQVPARRAAERDEQQITAWREETWPAIKGRGGPGRLAGLRGRVRSGAEAAEGAHLGRRGRTPVVRVTAAISPRVSVAALVALKPGHRPRLIYRTHRRRRASRRKGFTEADYAALLDAAHR